MRKTLLSYSPTINMTTDFAAWAQRPKLMNSLTFNMALTLVCLVCLAELTWSALCLQNFIAGLIHYSHQQQSSKHVCASMHSLFASH